MENVVSFVKEVEKKEPLIWMCDCGNCGFRLYEDGSVSCCECDKPQNYTEHYYTVSKWTRKVRQHQTEE